MDPLSVQPSIEAIIAISDVDTTPPGGAAIAERMGILSRMELRKSVLVVASHRGHEAVLYARRFGVCVTGVDIDPRMVQCARQNAKQAGCDEQVSFQEGDARQLPFDDSRFDIVTNEGAVGIPDGTERVLAEMVRVAKRGSTIVFRESVCSDTVCPAEREELRHRYGTALYQADEWKRMFAEAGARNIVTESEAWSEPQRFWKVRTERDVAHYRDIFSFAEKIATGKKILDKWGKEGLANAAENEKRFYEAVIAGKIGYSIFLGEKP